ncbi:thioredoxin family protein [Gelidibacter japonicus]|uniref:thioredoxin family protein n=1 Tax=Gelidibacter japonicus TaxID=1962232 RepID=UPI003A957161
MKTFKLIAIVFLLFGCKNDKSHSISQNHKSSTLSHDLIVIDQDYNEALTIASKENKLIFIDFYTTWCAPCKKLDKLVFQNDSIKQILKKDIILLKYNAENDTVFNLSKKHHVSSYPSGLILHKDGYILNRKYGFPGEDFKSLSNNVLAFINESVNLNKKDKILKGYSNKIDASKYPKFYVDYINRTNTKINPSEVNDYFNATKDIFSEEYFSTLLYFAYNASDNIANTTLENRNKYLTLYGKTDVETLMYFLTSGKFERAIKEKNRKKYEEAVSFAKTGLSKEWTDDILPSFEKDYLKAQNKWNEVFEINKTLKDNGKFDNGYVNNFCWQVYQGCDDKEVIQKSLKWMEEVTDEEPTYEYLDTYAHLMYNSGNKSETKRIAQLAIEAAKKENEKSESMEELINKL